MRRVTHPWALLLLLFISVASCTQNADHTPPAITNPAGASTTTSISAPPTRTPVQIPTLYPTLTPPPPPTALPTPTLANTPTPQSPADLTTLVLTFRYEIPVLGLDRSVEANAGGRIVLRDEVTGREIVLTNQGPVMEEMAGALSSLELDPIPEDCAGCVRFSYELPANGETGGGWLRDPVLLASVENYTAANLGPHFPAGTIAGLRRSATPFDPAHSIAVTTAGLLWRWLANVESVSAPVATGNYAALATAVNQLPALSLDSLQAQYTVDCPLTSRENLFLNPAGVAGAGSEATETATGPPLELSIICPGFSLPGILVPLYTGLDNALAETLAADPLTPPPLELPLDMMIDYQRADGARLTVRHNGQMVGQEQLGRTFTTTLPVSTVMTLTTGMAATGRMLSGVEQYTAGELPHLLLVRGPFQMWELGWRELAPPDLRPFIAQLDRFLDRLINPVSTPAAGETPSGTTTPAATPES